MVGLSFQASDEWTTSRLTVTAARESTRRRLLGESTSSHVAVTEPSVLCHLLLPVSRHAAPE